jgi:succinate dehydrogenase / fumarate reductase membrane anchor subunit
VFLAVLTPWIIGLLVALVGADHAQVQSALGKPINAIALAMFAASLFWHAKLGLQVVIEDYIHHRPTEIALQLLVTFACAAGALASLYAIGRIALLA